jgi:glycosyltransferase involved in cell wall biosynthesis
VQDIRKPLRGGRDGGDIVMRVLHVAQSVSGGIASYFEEIATCQSQRFGAQAVRFLIPAGSRHHLPSVQEHQIAEFAPVARSVRGLGALALAVHRELRSFRPDVLHLHSTFAGAIARPVALASGRRQKIVYCAHGWVFGMELPAWKRNLYALIERSLVPLTDKIVNISHTDYQLGRAHGLRPEKMVTIRNGIAVLPPMLPIEDPGLEGGNINLIFVGRHDRQKGLDILLRVFAEENLPGVHLHVVGAPVLEHPEGGPHPAMASNVTFYGWRSREEVSAMIAKADALVVPSRWEGFGLVAVEAMRLGKPVIASRRGGLAEIVEDGVSGLLFDLENCEQLKHLLKGLDRTELVSMGLAARQAFLSAFTADRLNTELIDLYHDLQVRGPRGTAVVQAIRRQKMFKRWSEKFGG